MFNFFGSDDHLVGIDLGHSSIKLVQLRSSGRGLQLVYAGLTELPVTETSTIDPGIGLALTDLLQRGKLKHEKAAVNFVGRAPVVRYLLLPKMPKDELKEAVKWEAK